MELLYKGKAKSVYKRASNTVVIEFRDDLTAGDGAKKESKIGKGSLNAEISSIFMKHLADNGIPTHFIDFEPPNKHITKFVKIILLEVICRNIATGSLLKRYPFKDGQKLDPPTVEIGLKDDAYHDPMLNDEIALALGLVKTQEEIETIKGITRKVNDILKEFLLEKGIKLVDFKLEFGYDTAGNLILADEVSPDTCRFWDASTNEIMDKDRFRKDMGDVRKFYEEVLRRIK